MNVDGFGIFKIIVGIVLVVFCAVVLVGDVVQLIKGTYEYSNKYESYWSLAEKASTISMKAQYMDKFVEALSSNGMEGQYNALWLTTPDNSFDQNMIALKTLQKRLHEIEGMDVTSFQYQTAIAQITAQEQGQAGKMLSVFEGIWWKNNHFYLWQWVGAIQIFGMITLIIFGLLIWASGADDL